MEWKEKKSNVPNRSYDIVGELSWGQQKRNLGRVGE
jgi:hypothetical protein